MEPSKKKRKARTIDPEVVRNTLFHGKNPKDGRDFIESLGRILEARNRNDVPFGIEDIQAQPELGSFAFPGINDFTRMGRIVPRPIELAADGWVNERLEVVLDDALDPESRARYKNELGCVYMITAQAGGVERVIKFGASRTPMSVRIRSYNCGTINNIRTASTTNVKIMQSLMACRNHATFWLHCFFCEKTNIHAWHGVQSTPVACGIALAYEDIVLNEWKKQFGAVPLANIQSKATRIKRPTNGRR